MNPIRNFEKQRKKVGISNGVKRFLIALQFLTILPVRVKPAPKKEDFGASLLYFPLAGLLIGIVLSLTASLLSSLPDNLKAVIVLIVSIVVTGGIHLDGFADTCDGFYGNNSRERILEIMRDSHIGTMGVVGVVSILLLKFSLIANFPEALLGKVLILMAVFSRWAQVLACYSASYSRESGKAKYFIKYATRKELVIGFFCTLALFCLFLKLKGFILFFVSVLSVLLFLQYIKKRIKGMTGDTIGALSELAEVSVFLIVFYTAKAF